MTAKRDYTPVIGKNYGDWTILRVYKENGNARATCLCTCGTLKEVYFNSIERGRSTNCGCLKKEVLRTKNTTHGNTSHPLWDMFYQMNERCSNDKHKYYSYYGGRGITVCDRWDINREDSFENFLEDMGERPEGMSLDRVDNNRGYSKDNCRWATREQQANNTRTVRFITHEDRTLSLSQWAREIGVDPTTLLYRLDVMGLCVQDALNWKKNAKQRKDQSVL